MDLGLVLVLDLAHATGDARGDPGAGHLRGLQANAHQQTVGERGEHVGRGQAGVRDQRAADLESLGGGVELFDHAAQPEVRRVGPHVDAGGGVVAGRHVECAVDFDHGADRNAGQAAGDALAEQGVVGHVDGLAERGQRLGGGIDRTHRADDLVADADRERAAVAAEAVGGHAGALHFGRHAQTQVVTVDGRVVVVGDVGRRVVEAHTVDDDRAEAGDRAR